MSIESTGRSSFVDIGKYQPGVLVVINKGGRWQKAELGAPAKKTKGKLELTLTDGSTVFVSEEPKILDLKDTIDDAERGKINIDVANARVVEGGRLEYDIRTSTGEVYQNVPGELLEAWSKVVDTEIKIDQLLQDIDTMDAKAQRELKESVANVKTAILKASRNLPKKIEQMPNQAKKAVKEAVAKIEDLHSKAEQNLTKLESHIAQVRLANTAPKPKVAYAESIADKDRRKTTEERVAQSKNREATAMQGELTQKVEHDKKTALQEKFNQKKQAWDNKRGTFTVTTEPALFNGTLTPPETQRVTNTHQKQAIYTDSEIARKAHESAELILPAVQVKVEELKAEAERLAEQFSTQSAEWEENDQIFKKGQPKESDYIGVTEKAKEKLLAGLRRVSRTVRNNFDDKTLKRVSYEHAKQLWGEAKRMHDAEKPTRPVELSQAQLLAEATEAIIKQDLALQRIVDTLRQAQIQTGPKLGKTVDIGGGVEDYQDPALKKKVNAAILPKLIAERKADYEGKLRLSDAALDQAVRADTATRQAQYDRDVAAWDKYKTWLTEEPKLDSTTFDPGEEVEKEKASRIDFVKAKMADPQLEKEINTRRHAKAADETDPSLVGGSPVDYKDADKRDEINVVCFEEMVADWQKPYNFVESVHDKDATLLDFTAEIKKVEGEFDQLLNDKDILESVPTTSNPTTPLIPKKMYRTLYDKVGKHKINTLKLMMSLETIDQARANPFVSTPTDPIDNQEKLSEARKEWVEKARLDLNELQEEIDDIKRAESISNTFVETKDITPIDMSSATVEKILFADVDKAKAAMRALYQGNGADAFRNLIDDTPPAGFDRDQLRKFGIKKWEDFVEVWHNTLAEQVAGRLEAMTKEKIMQKAKELLDSLEGFWAKAGIVKGQLAVRGLLQGLLTAGSAVGIRMFLSTYGQVVRDVAVLTSGTVIGAGKWKINKSIFGAERKWTKEINQKLKNLASETEEGLIQTMVDETFSTAAPQKKGFFKRIASKFSGAQHNKALEGVSMLSAVTASAIREVTAGESEIKVQIDGKMETLTGAEVARFNAMMAQVEMQNPEETDSAKLLAMEVILLNRKGDLKEAKDAVAQKAKPAIGDQFLRDYSGRGTLRKAVVWNTGLSAMFLASGTVRALFGTALGARVGYKAGKEIFLKSEHKEAKVNIAAKINKFTKTLHKIEEGQLALPPQEIEDVLTADEIKNFRTELIYLKKFLSGNAPQEDLMAAVQMSAEGAPTVDSMLLTQIDALVYDAEKLGVIMENRADVMDLKKVLKAMQDYRGKVSEKEYATLSKRFKKWAKGKALTWGGLLVGALPGAVWGWFGGPLKNLYKDMRQAVGGSESGHAHAASVDASNAPAVADQPQSPNPIVPSPAPVTPPAVSGATPAPGGSGDHLSPADTGPGALAHEPVPTADSLSEFLGTHTELLPRNIAGLQTVVAEYPALNNPESIAALAKVFQETDSGGKLDLHAEGIRSLEVFKQLKLVSDDEALKYLQAQDFSSKHLGWLQKEGFIKDGSEQELSNFVKKFDAEDEKMEYALRHALQGRKNTFGANAHLVPEKATATHDGVKIVVKGGKAEIVGFDKEGKPIVIGDKDAKIIAYRTHLVETQKSPHEISEGSRTHTASRIAESSQKSAGSQSVGTRVIESNLGSKSGVVAKSLGPDAIAYAAVDGRGRIVVGEVLATYRTAELAQIGGSGTVAGSESVATTSGTMDKISAGANKVGESVEKSVKGIARGVSSVFENKSSGGTTPDAPIPENLVSAADTQLKENLDFFNAKADYYVNAVQVAYSNMQNGFDYTGSGANLVREQFNKNFRTPMEYILKSEKGIPLTEDEKMAVNNFVDILKKGTGSSDGIEGAELQLSRDSNADKLQIVTNGSHAFRIKKPDGAGEILFGSDEFKFKTTARGELLKIGSQGVPIGTPLSYEEALALADPEHYPLLAAQ